MLYQWIPLTGGPTQNPTHHPHFPYGWPCNTKSTHAAALFATVQYRKKLMPCLSTWRREHVELCMYYHFAYIRYSAGAMQTKTAPICSWQSSLSLVVVVTAHNTCRGVATGDIWVYIPPKSVQVNFLLGKYNVRTAIKREYLSFIPPQKIYTPKTNFWLRPWTRVD